ncbi:4-hydroxy-3-methylbut-2-enyl diphosphate reductase [Sphingomonas sp. SRS2]|uniref:4-hydroxy-3-methylbut-2-enyl diphosphate reductase n=1 Tax=Sphingomonas sp. SRS2 TaxID=133190 RepID=UPI001F430823|nr:4-hydroxy-3-methylbut-2-enyl diphosphate reductase [Sphingomonas sp. SRS2]
MRVVLAAPRGFCAGVRRAIAAVETALDRFGAPIYVRRAIVHNLDVVGNLEKRGAIFVQEVDDVPPGSVLLLSAHGVAPRIRSSAQARNLRVFDAMCPLVDKVHHEVRRHHRDGHHVILIGHSGHPEIEGTFEQVPESAITLVTEIGDIERLEHRVGQRMAYATQTTFAVEDAKLIIARLQVLFPNIRGPKTSDICFATTNRQAAVRAIARDVDAFIVVGEDFSSNARRLVEVALAEGCPRVQLVADGRMIDWGGLADAHSIGVTAAASTPEHSVTSVLDQIGDRYAVTIEEHPGPPEPASFRAVEFA